MSDEWYGAFKAWFFGWYPKTSRVEPEAWDRYKRAFRAGWRAARAREAPKLKLPQCDACHGTGQICEPPLGWWTCPICKGSGTKPQVHP